MPPPDLEDHTHDPGNSADEFDSELTAEEKAEIRRIEKACTDLEKKLRGLNATQQPSLLEKLADSSNGGLLADTLRRTAGLRSRGGGEHKRCPCRR